MRKFLAGIFLLLSILVISQVSLKGFGPYRNWFDGILAYDERGYLYFHDAGRLGVVDLTNPEGVYWKLTSIRFLKKGELWSADGGSVYKNRLFVMFNSGSNTLVFILDVTYPFRPKIILMAKLPFKSRSIVAVDKTVFYITNNLGTKTYIYKFSSERLIKVGVLDFPVGGGRGGKFNFIRGNILISAVGDGFNEGFEYIAILDISNKIHPQLLSNISVTSARTLDVKGNYLIIARRWMADVLIYDLSEPSRPRLVWKGEMVKEAKIEVYGFAAQNIRVFGAFALKDDLLAVIFRDDAHDVYTALFDVSDPEEPKFIEKYNLNVKYSSEINFAALYSDKFHHIFIFTSKVVDVLNVKRPSKAQHENDGKAVVEVFYHRGSGGYCVKSSMVSISIEDIVLKLELGGFIRFEFKGTKEIKIFPANAGGLYPGYQTRLIIRPGFWKIDVYECADVSSHVYINGEPY